MRRGKVRSLFILLALNLGRSVARETILERLWPEKSRDAAIENFYTTWSRLAVILGGGDSGAKNSPYLSCDRQVCRLNPTYVKLDLVEFETLAKVVLFWQGTREDRIEAVYRMERLYRGDLLAAISHDSSVQALRERYRTLQVDALLTAAQLFCEIDNESTAIWFARLAFDLDPSREDVYLALMDMLGRMGQRTSAVRAYQDCKRYLEEKLGLAPSQKTTDLYQELILGSR
jgi:DNA-binding SARP family transcriptional activator